MTLYVVECVERGKRKWRPYSHIAHSDKWMADAACNHLSHDQHPVPMRFRVTPYRPAPKARGEQS